MYLLLLFAQDPTTTGLAGNAGWAGAGLLGLVLAWIFFFHLPAKDKQMEKMLADNARERADTAKERDVKDDKIEAMLKEGASERGKIIERFDAEREKDRAERHERAGSYQTLMNNANIAYVQTIKEIEEQHRKDALLDREAFMQRNVKVEEAVNKVEAAVHAQTANLTSLFQLSLQGVCKYERDREARKT